MKTQKLDSPASPRASLKSRQGTEKTKLNTAPVKPVETMKTPPEVSTTNTNKRIATDGWVEVLFRKTQKVFHHISKLVPADYELVGSPVPIKELTRPFDVYVMLHRGEFKGAPRPVAHGDIINVRIAAPTNAIRTYVMLDEKLAKATMVGGTHRIDHEPEFPLGMMVLPQKFQSRISPVRDLVTTERRESTLVLDIPGGQSIHVDITKSGAMAFANQVTAICQTLSPEVFLKTSKTTNCDRCPEAYHIIISTQYRAKIKHDDFELSVWAKDDAFRNARIVDVIINAATEAMCDHPARSE